MRFNNVFSGRPAFYDRNPLTKTNDFSAAAQAPTADTQEWIYTVPSSRKALITALVHYISRTTVAAPVGTITSRLLITTGAGTIQLGQISFIDNAVDVPHSVVSGGGAVLVAAEQVSYHYADTSTGGTVAVSGNSVVTEFDA